MSAEHARIELLVGKELEERPLICEELASLYVNVYSAPPWSESIGTQAARRQVETVLHPSPDVIPLLAYSRSGESGHVNAFSSGFVFTPSNSQRMDEFLINSPYFGSRLGPEAAQEALSTFWRTLVNGQKADPAIFIADTLRNLDDPQSLLPYFLSGIDILEQARAMGARHLVGVTIEESQIYQILDRRKLLTRVHKTGNSSSHPVLVFVDDLAALISTYTVLSRMAGQA